MDAVRGFAGGEPSRATYYPEDDRFLIERNDAAGSHLRASRESATLKP
jgi:hypothetical protein